MKEISELQPDKDGFLFEVEDRGYITGLLAFVFFVTFLFFILLAMNDFNFWDITRGGRLGVLVVFVSTPFFIYQYIYIFYYIYFGKKKMIRFYEDKILFEQGKNQIDIKEIDSFCFVGLGGFAVKGERPSVFIFIFLLIIYPIMTSCLLLSNYILNRKFIFNSLFIYMKKGENYAGFPYGILKDDDKKRVDKYFKKYLNQDINSISRKMIIIPKKRK